MSSTLGYRPQPHTARSRPHSAIDIIHIRLDLIRIRLDLIHTRLDVIHTRLDLILPWLDLFHTRLDLIPTRLDLIHNSARSHPHPHIYSSLYSSYSFLLALGVRTVLCATSPLPELLLLFPSSISPLLGPAVGRGANDSECWPPQAIEGSLYRLNRI
jgi:hypothetical protein